MFYKDLSNNKDKEVLLPLLKRLLVKKLINLGVKRKVLNVLLVQKEFQMMFRLRGVLVKDWMKLA